MVSGLSHWLLCRGKVAAAARHSSSGGGCATRYVHQRMGTLHRAWLTNDEATVSLMFMKMCVTKQRGYCALYQLEWF